MAYSWVHKDRGELRIYENLNELGTDLADYIAELSEASVKERGVFTIALSGGSLIGLMGYQCFAFQCFILFYILLYDSFLFLVLKILVQIRKLCEAPYSKTVDWAKWHIFWADERVVAKNHSDSNYKLAKDSLLSKVLNWILCILSFFVLFYIYNEEMT